jgi:hypothetical protein
VKIREETSRWRPPGGTNPRWWKEGRLDVSQLRVVIQALLLHRRTLSNLLDL